MTDWKPKIDEYASCYVVRAIDENTGVYTVYNEMEEETLTLTLEEFAAIVVPGDYMLRYTDEEGDAGLYGDPADPDSHFDFLTDARSCADERAWKSGIPIEVINWETREVVETVGEKYRGKGILQHDINAMKGEKLGRLVITNHLKNKAVRSPYSPFDKAAEAFSMYFVMWRDVFGFDISIDDPNEFRTTLPDGSVLMTITLEEAYELNKGNEDATD